jgi:hypothetical protein
MDNFFFQVFDMVLGTESRIAELLVNFHLMVASLILEALRSNVADLDAETFLNFQL